MFETWSNVGRTKPSSALAMLAAAITRTRATTARTPAILDPRAAPTPITNLPTRVLPPNRTGSVRGISGQPFIPERLRLVKARPAVSLRARTEVCGIESQRSLHGNRTRPDRSGAIGCSDRIQLLLGFALRRVSLPRSGLRPTLRVQGLDRNGADHARRGSDVTAHRPLPTTGHPPTV